MTLQEIFSSKYLFDPTPPRDTRLFIPLLVLFGVLIALSFLAKFAAIKAESKAAGKYFLNFLVPGIFGLLYLFARYEGLIWLGSRIFFLVILFTFFVWLVINTVWTIREIPKFTEEQKVKERYEKYLPKPKKMQKGK